MDFSGFRTSIDNEERSVCPRSSFNYEVFDT
jgi:hypothetical protein